MTKSYLLPLLICAFLVFGAWEIPVDSPGFPEITMSSDTAFGSGNFGVWETDEFGAPVYRYTCNQLTESRAVTRVNSGLDITYKSYAPDRKRPPGGSGFKLWICAGKTG
jgi:hypothetical protein